MMKKTIAIFLLIFIFLAPTKSWAWGMLGHRVVAEVASKHLTEKAAKRIAEILNGASMAEVSNWMDDIKSDPDKNLDTLKSYHYTTIPEDLDYHQTNINPKGDVIIGIRICVEKLKSGSLTNEEAERYLKMLIHFVGDIHQPLHVGGGKDLGGNLVNLTWFGTQTNLHKVWDSDMIDGKLYSYTELTNQINRATSVQINSWQNSTPVDWAHECRDLRKGIYSFDNKEKYWEYKYLYTHWETLKNQLLKGGIRLAGLLNEIFG